MALSLWIPPPSSREIIIPAPISPQKLFGDEDINRLVEQYIPHDELVVVLLKAADRTSANRIRSRPLEEDPDISTY